jgi:hypothetical protein
VQTFRTRLLKTKGLRRPTGLNCESWAKSGIYFIEPIPRTRDLAINMLRFPSYEISRLRVIHGPLPIHTPVLTVSPDERQITYSKFEHVTHGLMMLENVP